MMNLEWWRGKMAVLAKVILGLFWSSFGSTKYRD